MITGDHPGTALAVAPCHGHRRPLPGRAAVIDRRRARPDVRRAARPRAHGRSNVFARVLPEQKLRIVRALTASGRDRRDDRRRRQRRARRSEAAHVGIAMGRGTDAARAAADMILTDDNFATIVRAIRSGRGIYDNVLRFALFLLSANAGEVLVYAAAIGFGMSAPLTVLQILLVNLLTDGPPAVALGLDPPGRGVMSRPPRPRAEGVIEPIRSRLVVAGAVTGAAAFAAFAAGDASRHALGQTMAFTTLRLLAARARVRRPRRLAVLPGGPQRRAVRGGRAFGDRPGARPVGSPDRRSIRRRRDERSGAGARARPGAASLRRARALQMAGARSRSLFGKTLTRIRSATRCRAAASRR